MSDSTAKYPTEGLASQKQSIMTEFAKWRKEKIEASFRWWLRHPWWVATIVTATLLTLFYVTIILHGQIKGVSTANRVMFDELLAVAGIGIAVVFGVIGWFGSVVVEQMQSNMLSQIGSLQEVNDTLKKNVSNLEEVVRLRLRGIPEILGRAIYLVEHAMDELFVVTFTVRFGAVHIAYFEGEHDKEGVKVPGSSEYLTFQAATNRFWDLLRQRVVSVPKLRLLTVNGGARPAFLENLKAREGYNGLDIDRAHNDMNDSWDKVVAIAHTRGRVAGEADLRTTDALPFQMILARLSPESADAKARHGCLVFLVGSTTAQLNEAAAGFYTELDDFIEIYRNVAECLFASATKQLKPSKASVESPPDSPRPL